MIGLFFSYLFLLEWLLQIVVCAHSLPPLKLEFMYRVHCWGELLVRTRQRLQNTISGVLLVRRRLRRGCKLAVWGQLPVRRRLSGGCALAIWSERLVPRDLAEVASLWQQLSGGISSYLGERVVRRGT
jgi:hypothetical protein